MTRLSTREVISFHGHLLCDSWMRPERIAILANVLQRSRFCCSARDQAQQPSEKCKEAQQHAGMNADEHADAQQNGGGNHCKPFVNRMNNVTPDRLFLRAAWL